MTCLTAVRSRFSLYIPADGLIDLSKELDRLKAEEKRVGKIVNGLEKKLANPNFSKKAPPEIISETETKLLNMTKQWKEIKANLVSLNR